MDITQTNDNTFIPNLSFTTKILDNDIIMIDEYDNLLDQVYRSYLNTKEESVKKALKELGWIPPNESTSERVGSSKDPTKSKNTDILYRSNVLEHTKQEAQYWEKKAEDCGDSNISKGIAIGQALAYGCMHRWAKE